MNESTVNFSSEDISVELQKLGSSINFSSDNDGTMMYIETLTDNLVKTLEIAKEKLFNPAFTDEDFKRVKKTNIEDKKKEDPFMPPFEEGRFIDNLSDTHSLIHNRYSVS